MGIRRVVPDIATTDMDLSRKFYADFLGFNIGMDMGWVVTFVSPDNPTAQVTVIAGDGSGPAPDLSVEVTDVDAVHRSAIEHGLEIIYPLTDEPWGVRRFFVTDPNGMTLNIMSHHKG